MARRAHGLLLVAALAATIVPPLATASGAPRPHAHVVIAFVGESPNPYQRDFAAPGRNANPHSWLPGYPAASRPLRLHLREPDLQTAIKEDDGTWRSVQPGQLYYVPGTRISGMVYLPSPLDHGLSSNVSSDDPTAVLNPPRPIIDGNTFHGTGVASVAAGNRFGACPDCDIVMVASDDEQTGLDWAAHQPWIDIISNSYGGPSGLPTQATPGHPDRAANTSSTLSRNAAASGHAVIFASGNGVTDLGPTTHGTQHSLTWESPFAGPPWVLTVGASKPDEQPTDWHNIPVDLLAQGESRPAADFLSTSGEMQFYGTSCSAPIVAGVLGEALIRARQALGDLQVGPRAGQLLTNPKTGARWSYLKLFDAARAVAQWHSFDPSTLAQDPFITPTTPVGYVYEGYGVVDRDSINPLVNVLLGRERQPERPEMAQWAQLNQQVRTQLWGAAPSPGR